MNEPPDNAKGIKILLTENAGMCFGVKRALSLALDAAQDSTFTDSPVYVVGQLIHNPQVSGRLAEQGIKEITEEGLKKIPGRGGVFIIPSHGKGPQVYDIVKNREGSIIDAVCPFVRQALEKARKARDEGYFLLIYGDGDHDEVKGYGDWLGDGYRIVLDFEEELKDWPPPPKLAVMAQTTANQDGFGKLLNWLQDRDFHPLILDTICGAAGGRREAAKKIALQAGAMLVVGGKNSANTVQLAEYCAKLTQKTYLIETRDDIVPEWFRGVRSVGITAGASTPEWIIEEVVDMMEEFKDQEFTAEPEESQDQVSAPESEVSPEVSPQDEAESPVAQEGEGEPEAAQENEPASEEVLTGEAGPETVQQEEAGPETDQQAETEPEAVPQEEPTPEAVQLAEPEPEAAPQEETDPEAEADFSEMEAEMGYLDFHPGDIIKGTVVKVSSDEVLVDIGYKSEGIIPTFELAFTKVDPTTVVKVGDEISVEVLKEDRDGNIVLSRKNALFEEKINLLEELFEKGEPIKATVIDVVKGGLLVDVGMRGFVPASHVERGFVKDLSEYLKKELDFKILELNRSGRKVILSRKALLEEEYQKNKETFWNNIEEGQTRKGVVKRLTDFGAFVDIGGCDGLLHVSEMGWGKVGKPYDVVSINDEIEVYVLKVDRDKEKVSLSLKKLLPNPWDLASEKYKVGEIYEGTVMRGASFGAFIQLEPSLEGLAHISQLARFRVNKVEDVLTEGMIVPVKILDIDLDKRRISLSVKEVIDLPRLVKDEAGQEASPVEEYAGEAAIETVEETISETVADAIGESVAEALAEAVAASAAIAAKEAMDEAVADVVAEEAIEQAAEVALEAVSELVAEEIAEEIAEEVAEEIAGEAVEELIEGAAEAYVEAVAEEMIEEAVAGIIAEEIATEAEEEGEE